MVCRGYRQTPSSNNRARAPGCRYKLTVAVIRTLEHSMGCCCISLAPSAWDTKRVVILMNYRRRRYHHLTNYYTHLDRIIDGQACAWPFCFYSKTGFWPSYCQISTEISTDLGNILHTPIVVRNTLVGRLRSRSARHGRLQANQNDCFFVILVTHPISPI